MKYELPYTKPIMASEPFDTAAPKECLNDVLATGVMNFDNRFSLTDEELREVAAKSIESVREGKLLTADQAMNYFNSL